VQSAGLSRYTPMPISRMAVVAATLDLMFRAQQIALEERAAADMADASAAASAALAAKTALMRSKRSAHDEAKARLLDAHGLSAHQRADQRDEVAMSLFGVESGASNAGGSGYLPPQRSMPGTLSLNVEVMDGVEVEF